MRILVPFEYYRPHVSGVLISAERTCIELQRRGHEVLALIPSEADVPPVDLPVERLPVLPRVTRFDGPTIAPSTALRSIADAFSPELVHFHGAFVSAFVAGYVRRRCGARTVYTCHTILRDYAHYAPAGHRFWTAVLPRWQAHVAGRANAVVVPSVKARHYLREVGFTGHTHLVPTGVEAEVFRPDGPGRRRERGDQLAGGWRPLTVVFCGRLAPEKRLLALVGAVLHVDSPMLRLVLVGDGPERPALEKLVAGRPSRSTVHFTGLLDQGGVAAEMRRADALVLPSLREVQPLVVHEALSCGLPVICPVGTAQAEEVVDGHTGWLVDRSDDALGDLLLRLSTTPGEVRRMGERVTSRRERTTTVADTVDLLEALYAQLLDRRTRHRLVS
jgi:glycosyltransferase involved in cell wall biosynthesis